MVHVLLHIAEERQAGPQPGILLFTGDILALQSKIGVERQKKGIKKPMGYL
jgi:hypothetical protein